MRVLLPALAIAVVFSLGCRQEESRRIVLRISQVKPYEFDTLQEGILYTDPVNLLCSEVPVTPGPNAVHLQQGRVDLDDVLYPGGRAFEKWEYLTIEVDGDKSYTPRPHDLIEVGTIRNPPTRIRVSGPIRKPLYIVLQIEPGLDEPDYWILAKDVFQVDDPDLILVLDHKQIKRPNKPRHDNPY